MNNTATACFVSKSMPYKFNQTIECATSMLMDVRQVSVVNNKLLDAIVDGLPYIDNYPIISVDYKMYHIEIVSEEDNTLYLMQSVWRKDKMTTRRLVIIQF
jgi:hypothetical protein